MASPVTNNNALLWSFQHFFHTDKANAALHCAPVRFSPITFQLLYALLAGWSDHEDITAEMAEVQHHRGQYNVDPGR